MKTEEIVRALRCTSSVHTEEIDCSGCPYRTVEILERARICVCGDREQDYGSPERNFETIAELWTTYLNGVGIMTEVEELEPHDVAAMLGLLEIARIASGHAKDDNWIAIAGYAACGGELQAT